MGLRKRNNIRHKGKKLIEILAEHEQFWKGAGIRADLTGADLSGADLSKVNLAGAILRNANLDGTDLRGARLPGADFAGARLRKADLRNTDMTEASLAGADLTEAQASGVEFFRCDLRTRIFIRLCCAMPISGMHTWTVRTLPARTWVSPFCAKRTLPKPT